VKRFSGTVTFLDGRSERYSISAVTAMREWERYAVRNKLPYANETPPILLTYMAIWKALAVEQGFDAWVDTVDGFDEDPEPDEVDPTFPDRSAELISS